LGEGGLPGEAREEAFPAGVEILAAAGRAAIGKIFYRTQMNADYQDFRYRKITNKNDEI
jgi:hypothetical protein